MRRLVKHGIAGVGFLACTVTAAVAVLGSPAGTGSAIAVPAPVTSVSAPAGPSSVDPTTVDPTVAARDARESRAAARAQLTAAATQQAVERASTLGQQSVSIAAQQRKIKADRTKAKAAAKAKAEREAEAEAQARSAAAAAKKEEAAKRAKEINKRGYKPGTTEPKEIARQILANKFHYGPEQFTCFTFIIERESDWKVKARNPSSGAYGIPQALPGSKMASAGSDWRTNPATQIIWAVGYMDDRYGSPCQARNFKASHGWY